MNKILRAAGVFTYSNNMTYIIEMFWDHNDNKYVAYTTPQIPDIPGYGVIELQEILLHLIPWYQSLMPVNGANDNPPTGGEVLMFMFISFLIGPFLKYGLIPNDAVMHMSGRLVDDPDRYYQLQYTSKEGFTAQGELALFRTLGIEDINLQTWFNEYIPEWARVFFEGLWDF